MCTPASTSLLFTLRGHHVGVTALVHCNFENSPCLISGDQEGSLILWNLITFKRIASHSRICTSQVQSLRVVQLKVEKEEHAVLVAQSRNDGLYLLDLSTKDLKQLANYSTYEALFSRGDSFSRKDNSAILAYPSCINNHLVTVRLVGENAKTILSGSAQRFRDEDKTASVFDIVIREVEESRYALFVAYEDSTICAFSIDLDNMVHVPVIKSSGLRIGLLRKFDLDFKDFVTSLDVQSINKNYRILCGTPTKDVYVVTTPMDLESPQAEKIDKIPMKRRGVSSVVISSDCDLVALGCWDSSIVLYSITSKAPFATLHYHMRQAQDLFFIDAANVLTNHDPINAGPQELSDYCRRYRFLLCCASIDGTISLTCIK